MAADLAFLRGSIPPMIPRPAPSFGIACFAMLLPLSATASSPSVIDTFWTAGGLRACTTESRQFNPLLARDGQGGVIISWCDARGMSGGSQVFTTRLTSLGAHVPGWPDSGLLVAAGYATDQAMAPDSAGGAFFTWPVFMTVTMQHVLANGSIATSPPSVPAAATRSFSYDLGTVTPDDVKKFEPRPYSPLLLPDVNNGTFVCWPTWSITSYRVYVQDVTASGITAPNWLGPLMLTDGYEPIWGTSMCTDGSNGVFVAWSTWVYGDTTSSIMLDRAASGAIASPWLYGGIHVCRAGGPQVAPAVVADGTGGAIVFWNDSRHLTTSRLYATRILADTACAPGWPSDGLMISSHICQPGTARLDSRSSCQSALSDGAGGAFVAWSDSRSDAGDVFVQHILPDGTHPGWPAEGVAVCTTSGLQSLPRLALDGAGGIFVTWQDERSAVAQTYVQHVVASGAVDPIWPGDGLAVCPTTTAQTHPVLESDGELGAFIAWEDARSGVSLIYAAHVLGDAVVPIDLSLLSSDVGPGFARLTWDASSRRNETFTIERRTETSAWTAMMSISPDPSGRIVYDDRDVDPGVRYGYRISSSADPASGMAETWVTIPLGGRLTLAPCASPARDLIRADFTLPDGARATLSLLDIAGRVLESHEVGALGAGQHSLSFASSRGMTPGIYFIRLSHAGDSIARRAAFIR
jgi:hypothetical protein